MLFFSYLWFLLFAFCSLTYFYSYFPFFPWTTLFQRVKEQGATIVDDDMWSETDEFGTVRFVTVKTVSILLSSTCICIIIDIRSLSKKTCSCLQHLLWPKIQQKNLKWSNPKFILILFFSFTSSETLHTHLSSEMVTKAVFCRVTRKSNKLISF